MTKYVGKILLWNSKRLLRKLPKSLKGYFFSWTLYGPRLRHLLKAKILLQNPYYCTPVVVDYFGAIIHSFSHTSTHSRQKKSANFPDKIAGNMSNKCTFINSNSPRILRDWQYEYSSLQVCYFVELPQSNFSDNTNTLIFPWPWPNSVTFP